MNELLLRIERLDNGYILKVCDDKYEVDFKMRRFIESKEDLLKWIDGEIGIMDDKNINSNGDNKAD